MKRVHLFSTKGALENYASTNMKGKKCCFQEKILFHEAQQPTKYIEVRCNEIERNESFYQCQFYLKYSLQWNKMLVIRV